MPAYRASAVGPQGVEVALPDQLAAQSADLRLQVQAGLQRQGALVAHVRRARRGRACLAKPRHPSPQCLRRARGRPGLPE